MVLVYSKIIKHPTNGDISQCHKAYSGLTVSVVQFVRKKTEFYDRYNAVLNERQRKAINKMFNEGIAGFEGGMSSKKYISINKTTKSTATHDLQELADKNIFVRKGAGRSTSYDLNLN